MNKTVTKNKSDYTGLSVEKKAEKIVDTMVRLHSRSLSQVFEDILDLYICINSFGRQEDVYKQILSYYSKDNLATLSEVLGNIIISYDPYVKEKTTYDLLGTIYETLVGKHKQSGLGQFFTPVHVTDLISQIILSKENDNIILANEPTCGSGRNVISAFNLNSNVIFNAIDLDRICVKMSIVNMHLYGMLGSEVIRGDSLALKSFGGYRLCLAYPIVEKMFGEAWNSLSVQQRTELNEINSKLTLVIKQIEPENIFDNESIYFKQIRQNIEFKNNIGKAFNSVLNDNSDKQENKTQENILAPEITIDPVIIENTEKFEFKNKYKNQISLFD